MATHTISQTVDIRIEECYSCSAFIALTASHKKTLLENHANFYCPNGHRQHYLDETEAQKWETRFNAERDHLNGALTRLSEAKKELKRVKTRAKNGVCPKCHRTFKQVAAHVKRQHADAPTP